jgi:ABC-2 type transport system permease protein
VSQSLVLRLVRKDLYLCRWLMAGALIGGAISLAVIPLGSIAFYVGSVTFMGVVVVLNVMLVSLSIVSERKEKVAHFMLSLPISTAQYVTAKLIANCLAFFVPFVLLMAACTIVVRVTAIPDGFIPVTFAILSYIVVYYAVLLVTALRTDSAIWFTAVIIFGNVSINFVIAGLLRDPEVARVSAGEDVIWTTPVLVTLILELALAASVLIAGWYFATRKKNFV